MEMIFNFDKTVVTRFTVNFMRPKVSMMVNPLFGKMKCGGYPQKAFDALWEMCDGENLDRNTPIAVMDDWAGEMIYELFRRDFTNITLVSTTVETDDMMRKWLKRLYAFPIDLPVFTVPEVYELNKHFDLMIANPPYSIANRAICQMMPHVDKAVVLMPGSAYKGNGLYKQVEKIKPVDNKMFSADGATLCDLTVGMLDNKVRDIAWVTEFIYYRYDPEILDFVKENAKHNFVNCSCMPYVGHARKLPPAERTDRTFLISARVLDDGVHNEESSVDCQYNLYNKIVKNNYSYGEIIFHTAKEKENLARFWYKNPLMNKILKGANSSSFRTEIWNLVPKLDYSVDRDYENLTLEDIIKILKEEGK